MGEEYTETLYIIFAIPCKSILQNEKIFFLNELKIIAFPKGVTFSS